MPCELLWVVGPGAALHIIPGHLFYPVLFPALGPDPHKCIAKFWQQHRTHPCHMVVMLVTKFEVSRKSKSPQCLCAWRTHRLQISAQGRAALWRQINLHTLPVLARCLEDVAAVHNVSASTLAAITLVAQVCTTSRPGLGAHPTQGRLQAAGYRPWLLFLTC